MTTILIIEDHESLREQLMEALEMQDYVVFGAVDGDIGLKLAQELRPDLILCDVMMTTMNGFEVLQQLRDDPKTSSTPFIFMTARSDRDAMRYGMSLGADDFIVKPFTTRELMAAIELRLERRQAMVKDAERKLDQSRQQLVHMITHELRTPLTSINMVVDILARHITAENQADLQELVDTLGAGNRRLSHIVEQMVLVTQLQSGAISSDNIRERGVLTPVQELVVGAIGVGRRFAYQNHNLTIDVEHGDGNTCVRCNPQPLKYALAELISNALNFSPGESVVTLKTSQAGDQVHATISDRGPGIDPSHMERAFELFQQINRERQEQQGMGLGLGIALHVIEAHGGNLALDSAPGNGTRVTVRLPVAIGAAVMS